MTLTRANMTAGDCHRQEQRRIVLNAQPLQCIVAVRQPDTLRAFKNAEIDPPATRRAALDLDLRKRFPQPVNEGERPLGLCGIHYRQYAVVIPFDVVDLVVGQHRTDAVEQIVAHVCPGRVQHQLLSPFRLVRWAEDPLRVRAIKVRVAVDHFRFEPNSERHAKALHMRDQRSEAIGILARVHSPIAESAGIVVPLTEPAIVQYKAFRAQIGGPACNLF